jgi:hypothetical protein
MSQIYFNSNSGNLPYNGESGIWVDGVNGSDSTGNGSAINPFKTITHANSTISGNSTTNRFVVHITNICTEPGNVSILPFVSYVGFDKATCAISSSGNSLVLDSSWSGLSGATATIKNITLSASTSINFNWFALASGSGCVMFLQQVTNANTNSFTGRGTDQTSTDLCTLASPTIIDMQVNSNSDSYTGTTTWTSTNSMGADVFQSVGSKFGNITISETSGQTTSAIFYASAIGGNLSVTGASASVQVDAASFPQGSITLASSATLSPIASLTYQPIGAGTYTGGTYTFALTDQQNYIRFSNAGAQTVTIPTNASVPFPIGAEINGIQAGAGQVTFSPAGGVTVNAKGAVLSISGQYGGFSLKQYATNSWDLVVA